MKMNKMSINKSNVRSLAAAIVAALILPSCINLDENQGEGVGYLELPGLTADVEVYELVPTKSGTTTLSALVGVTGYNLPDIEAITFNLTDQESYSKTWTGALNGTLELPVGTYTLSGKYDNAEYDGLGEALYGDFTTTVTISSQGTVTPEIKLPLINSLVAVSMAKDFDKHFTPDKGDCVTFTSRNASVSAAVGKYVFVPASSKLTVSVKGTNSAGVETLTYDDELTSPAAKTACSIVCGMSTTDVPSVTLASDLSAVAFEDVLYFLPAATVTNISDANAAKLTYEIMGGSYSDWNKVVSEITANGNTYKYITGLTSGTTYSLRARVGNIFSEGVSFTFTPVYFADCVSVVASADHTKDDNGDLDGTKVTASVSVTNLPSIIKELATVTATEGTFKNSAETTRSTAAVTALSKDGQTSLEMKNPDGWPYIPQGENHTMTVNVTCTLNGKTYEAISSKSGITVPAPEFSVTVSAYTSYDKYAATNNITKDIAGANNCDPKTLYNAGAKWGISTALMENGNYAKTLVVDIDGNTDRTFEVTTEYADNKYYENIPDLSWASHSLAISFTFDGVTVKKQQTHHITGLPYDLTHPAQDWEIVENGVVNYTYFGDSYIFLTSDSSTGSVKTPSFHIPDNVNIAVASQFQRIRDGIAFEWTYSIHTFDSSGNTNQIAADTGNGKNTIHTISGNASFTPTCYNILCRRYYWGGSGPDAQINTLTIDYR